ncbi:hypothetical protein Isop_2983 [Isosphaera pallida ATCC 43644]|uniref:TMEM205-like domain-containing protein n=1 Tax=Isosphaera pallida (strain ATCC 43644 / DSM 9630 / IS1B) TaxID=575540 RepID=E8R2Q1_ISOPI|nr:DUF4149 domain-containing protein [Isosphaera pallida]ADV63548.1 hypothetical protein Isop_2983 [Isosphaera pallida ATCC 43644]
MFDSPNLILIFDAAASISAAVWLGTITFFSFGVAPVVFRTLEPASASTFLRAVFPVYYAFGLGASIVLLPALTCRGLALPEARGPLLGLQLVAVLAGIVIQLYCRESLTPAINQARDAGPQGEARFKHLHRRSVRLNVVVLIIALMATVLHGARPAPRTSGIEEFTPQERAAYDFEFLRELYKSRRQADENKRRNPDPEESREDAASSSGPPSRETRRQGITPER